MPKANTHGVLEPTEVIEHITPSGARLRIKLAQCTDGWREGVSYWGQWCGGGYAPNIKHPAHPTRGEALDFALGLLSRRFASHERHELSGREAAQRDEVIAWCSAQKQQELFACSR